MDIRIKNTHAQLLLDAYDAKIEAIDQQLTPLQKKKIEYVEAKRDILRQINGEQVTDTIPSSVQSKIQLNGYDYEWTWVDKAKYILKKSNAPLSSAEIVDQLLIVEPNIKRSTAMKSLSSILGVRAKAGIDFLRANNSTGDNVYSLK